ncbi:IS3 family transposase [bacterium]|nr:IS3 family transposase [bacterium]
MDWVDQNHEKLGSKKKALKAMRLSSTTYYSDPKISRSERESFEADVRGKIEQIRIELPGSGYRTLLPVLKRLGVEIGERKLRQILSKFKLQIRPKKKFVKTTNSNHKHRIYANLIEEMTVTDANQVWASDITYIRIENGFVYLAVILDLFSRKVVGWQISKRIDGELVIDAVKMAIARRQPPRGVIHHSDRGVQYLCEEYVEELTKHGFYISCSAKGNPYDNAWVESFMKTLKVNEVYMWEYKTYLDVLDRVPRFIEEVYNKKRPHSSLGYLSPEEFEKCERVGYQSKSTVNRSVTKL